MISFSEALGIISACESLNLGTELISLHDALGRVLAADVLADRNYPPFNRASMDGFAVRKEDWDEGQRQFDIIGELLAGQLFDEDTIKSNSALKIMTGAATPKAYDVIVRIEDCVVEGGKVSFSIDKVTALQNIAKEGEDISLGEKVMAIGQVITLGSITALASVGASQIEVYRLPQIAIVTTGDEIVPVSSCPAVNQIRNSNAVTLQMALGKIGIGKVVHEHVNDSKEGIATKIKTLVGVSDIILFTGGVSAGSADFVPQVLEQSGFTKRFHKVKIKPGKPAWFGVNDTNGKVVFALPGNPLSVLTTYKIFVESFILKMIGKSPINYSWKQIAVNRPKKVELDEFFPYLASSNAHANFLEPLKLNGSGDITATLFASGLAHHPVDKEQLTVGAFVKVFEF